MKQPQNKTVYPWRTEPEIDLERQNYLAQCLTIMPDTQQGVYPFRDIKLCRADIEWLLTNHGGGGGPVDWGDELQRDRVGIDLRGANLCNVNLRGLPLARICCGLTDSEWHVATLEQRDLSGVQLAGADLSEAHLEGANLRGANFERATLRQACLQRAILYRANLKDTYLRNAHLEDTNAITANLSGAHLRDAHFERSDLRGAYFNSTSRLEDVTFSSGSRSCAKFADVHWGDANLSLTDWTQITILGDEVKAQRYAHSNKPREKGKRIEAFREAARANRQLSNAMRAQGMNEESIPFAYRAQVLQRQVYWRQALWSQTESPSTNVPGGSQTSESPRLWRRIRYLGSYIFSWFLDILAGYGYKPGRSLFIYLLMIAGFATCYSIFGNLPPREAVIFSVTSFHGRGFFPGTFSLGSPITALAALEAVAGLLIEISFIATFTQRFFGR